MNIIEDYGIQIHVLLVSIWVNQLHQVHYEENWKPNPKPKITQTGTEQNYKIDRTDLNPTWIYKFDSHL